MFPLHTHLLVKGFGYTAYVLQHDLFMQHVNDSSINNVPQDKFHHDQNEKIDKQRRKGFILAEI